MFILLEALTPNGANATAHRVKKVEIAETVRVYVNSFASPQAELLVWQDSHDMPVFEMSNGVYPDCVYNWLVSPTGPYPGGEIMADPTDFELRKARLMGELKTIRDQVIAGGCATPFGLIDTDNTSLRNIMGSYQSAVLALMTNSEYAVSWRMQDNSLVTLTAPEMIAVGNAVLARVEASYQRSWTLKEDIETATEANITDIDLATGWPE